MSEEDSYQGILDRIGKAQMELKLRLEQVSKLRGELYRELSAASFLEIFINESTRKKNLNENLKFTLLCCSGMREEATEIDEALQAAVSGDTGIDANHLRGQ